METIITNTITGASYTLDAFEDQAPALFAGDPECIAAARNLVMAICRREPAQEYANFLACSYT